MNNLPKFKDFDAPEDYFEHLPDQILVKIKSRKSFSWTKYAAAAAVLVGLGISWQWDLFAPAYQPLSTEEEADLYIESQLWTAEDVLNLSDEPNALLDQIIEEELTASEELWADDELNWF